MEENNQNEEIKTCETTEGKKHICFKDHCWKMCIGMVAAAFLGGFLATYFVADQMADRAFKRHYHNFQPGYNQKMLNDVDREFNREMRHFNKMIKKHNMDDFFKNDFPIPPIFFGEPVKIDTDMEDGSFNVKVSLKPFQNDENKINYNIAGRKLTVFGASKVDDGKNEQDISFSQDFILPENADTVNIKKEKHGNNLVISVPMKN